VALAPLVLYQGQTFRATIGVARDLPTTPTVAVAVENDVVTFSGSPGIGLTANVTVTYPDASVVSFVVALGDDAPLEQIASVVAAAVAWPGNGTYQSFASTATGESVTIAILDSGVVVAATITSNTFFDMTGATALMKIRKTYAGPALIILTTPEADPGGLEIDPVTGAVTFTLTAQQTASFPISRVASTTTNAFTTVSTAPAIPTTPFAYFPFDIQVTNPDGDVSYVPELALQVFAVLSY
jgi:hypothetical protein